MARNPSPDRFKARGVTAEAAPDAEWVAVTQDTALPARFTIRANLEVPDCFVTLAVVAGPTCEVLVKQVVLDVPVSGNAELTTSTVRGILIHQLVMLAREQIERPLADLNGEVVRSAFDARLLKPRQPRRTTAERVEESARLFREALDGNVRGPGKYVAERLGVSESQASRYLQAARENKLLANETP